KSYPIRGVISCVGGFAFFDQKKMEKINGLTNQNVCKVAKECGVDRFVFISVHNYTGWISSWIMKTFLHGYIKGKRDTEEIVKSTFGDNGISLRPGFVSGTKYILWCKIPLFFQVPGFIMGYITPVCSVDVLAACATRFIDIND